LFLSPYAGAMAWVWLLAPRDGLLLNHVLDRWHISLAWLEIYSLPGVIFVLTLFHTPIVYLLLVPALRDTDPAFEETARVHGATFWYISRHITLPMARSALSTAAAIVFITSAGLFDVPAVLGLPRGISFIPTEIFAMARTPSDFGQAAAFAVLAIVAALGFTQWHRRFSQRRPIVAISGGRPRARVTRLRWPVQIAALALEAAYLTASVLLPLMALLLVAFSRRWTGRFERRNVTSLHFDYIMTHHELALAAIGNSLILAVLGATAGAALAVGLTYYLTDGDRKQRARSVIPLTDAHGIPAIVLGLGFLVVAVRTPIYGTIGIVLIACVARIVPLVTGLVAARVQRNHPDLERMARTSGANRWQTMRHIIGPSLRRSLLASWLLLFALFIRELATPVLLYVPGNETIGVAMTVLIDRNPSYVAVLALIQMAILLLAFAIFTLSRAPLDPRPA
jgi:iron(III) transport system permease protein